MGLGAQQNSWWCPPLSSKLFGHVLNHHFSGVSKLLLGREWREGNHLFTWESALPTERNGTKVEMGENNKVTISWNTPPVAPVNGYRITGVPLNGNGQELTWTATSGTSPVCSTANYWGVRVSGLLVWLMPFVCRLYLLHVFKWLFVVTPTRVTSSWVEVKELMHGKAWGMACAFLFLF